MVDFARSGERPVTFSTPNRDITQPGVWHPDKGGLVSHLDVAAFSSEQYAMALPLSSILGSPPGETLLRSAALTLSQYIKQYVDTSNDPDAPDPLDILLSKHLKEGTVTDFIFLEVNNASRLDEENLTLRDFLEAYVYYTVPRFENSLDFRGIASPGSIRDLHNFTERSTLGSIMEAVGFEAPLRPGATEQERQNLTATKNQSIGSTEFEYLLDLSEEHVLEQLQENFKPTN